MIRILTAVLLLLATLTYSCYEPVEGCLDIAAVNFNASADEECCFEYPTLRIQLIQRFDTLVYLSANAYTNNLGQVFRLDNAVFYLHRFSFSQLGNTYPVTDSLALQVFDGPDTTARVFTDDFLLLRRTAVNYTAGSFSQSGNFDQFRFQLGIAPDAQQIIPGLAPANHPLRPQPDNLWLGRDTGFVALQLLVSRDTSANTPTDTLNFTRTDFDNLVIEKNGNFFHETGFDFNLRLTIDYAEMFRNVDWQNGDKNAWKSQIIANLPAVFRVTQ